MKLVIDCRYLGKSGIGTYLGNIIDELIINHLEHQYFLICEKGTGMLPSKNVEIFETDIKPFSLKELFLFPVSRINQCDAYFSPYINLPLRIKIPVYCTIHDVIFLDRRELTSWVGYLIRKLYIWNALRMSHAVFTVSEFSKRRILHFFRTKKEIIVTYNVISSVIKEATSKVQIIEKSPYIMYVGNIKKHKGLELLLKGYTKALSRGFLPKLYLVGSADKFRTSDRELDSLIRYNPNVKFTGFLPNEDLHKMIAKAMILVLPSYYEGFGLTPLEGLYLGTDVLISDIEVLKEVYGELPVTFFKCGDVDDLARALLEHHPVMKDVKKARILIDKNYNIGCIVNVILNTIAKS